MAKASKVDKKLSKKKEEKPAKKVEEESSSEESSSDDSSSEESSSDDDSSDDSSSSSSDEGSDSDSSDEEEVEKKESSSDESDDEEKKESSSDESDDEDKKEESSSGSDEEEKKEEKSSSSDSEDSSSSDSSSSESDSGSDSDSDSDSEEEPSKKRKAEESKEEESAPVKKSKPAASTEEPATLFVGRLSWNIDDAWLKREFEHIGGVIGARVIMERATGKSRGYGYVDFESKSAAEKALEEMQGKEIDGRPINLDMSTGKPHASKSNNDRAKQYGDSQSPPSDTLFIGNLSFNANRDNLFNVFGEYGNVISCRVPTHPDTQQPKGFGYVQFSSVEEAKAALEAMNGEYIEGRPCRLDFSTPRDNTNNNNNNRRGGFGGGFGGRERSATPRSGNSTPRPNKSTEFKGTKKTFD